MQQFALRLIVAICSLLLVACGEQPESAMQTHTEALERANEALEMQDAAAAARRRAIDEQSR